MSNFQYFKNLFLFSFLLRKLTHRSIFLQIHPIFRSTSVYVSLYLYSCGPVLFFYLSFTFWKSVLLLVLSLSWNVSPSEGLPCLTKITSIPESQKCLFYFSKWIGHLLDFLHIKTKEMFLPSNLEQFTLHSILIKLVVHFVYIPKNI